MGPTMPNSLAAMAEAECGDSVKGSVRCTPHRSVLAEERRLVLGDLCRTLRRSEEEPGPGRRQLGVAEVRVVHRQARGGDGELAEATRGPRLESRHELAGAEVRDLRRDAHRILADVEARDGLSGRDAAAHGAPHRIRPHAGGRHDPEAGDDDPAARHRAVRGWLPSQPALL